MTSLRNKGTFLLSRPLRARHHLPGGPGAQGGQRGQGSRSTLRDLRRHQQDNLDVDQALLQALCAANVDLPAVDVVGGGSEAVFLGAGRHRAHASTIEVKTMARFEESAGLRQRTESSEGRKRTGRRSTRCPLCLQKLVRKSRVDVEGADQEHRGDGVERQPEPGAGEEPRANASNGEPTHASDGKILRKIVAAGGKTEGDRMAFSDERVVREVKSLFVAGTDTTGHSLSWAFYFIATRPDLLARCRKEALEVAPETNGLVTTPRQSSRLVFCCAVFMESLRLRPAGTRLVVHNVEDYTMKNGFEAPKGTAFFLLTRYMALSEETFTRAREFIPERWIEAEREDALLGKKVGDEERTVRHRKEAFLAFGSGPRSCPGQEMVKTEATILLAAVCARFNISLAPGQPNPPQEVAGFTSRPEMVDLVLTRA